MAVNDYGAFPRHQDLADLTAGDPHTQYNLVVSGIAAARPSPGRVGRFYFSTDTGLFSVDNGSSWTPLTAPTAGPAGTSAGNYARSFLMGD